MQKLIAASLLALSNVAAQDPPLVLYKCDKDSWTCVECQDIHEGGCNYKSGCDASCGQFSPEDLRGDWRGLSVKVKEGDYDNFEFGEVDMTFLKDTVSITHGKNQKVGCETSTSAGDSVLLTCEGVKNAYTYGTIGNLKYTTAYGLSTFANATYPDSFAQGLRSNNTDNYIMFRCNSWGGNSTCKFGPDGAKELAKELMFGKVEEKKSEAPECMMCNKLAQPPMCTPCECKSSTSCVAAEQCKSGCSIPPAERYRCDWTHGDKCVLDEKNGTMTKDECTKECKAAKYAKCDYKNNKCLSCKPGADDKDCIYLESYCNLAQKEGRCAEEHLTGLWRTIESNIPFNKGEFDIQFSSGKMYIQYAHPQVTAHEVGDIKRTGDAEKGGVLFQITNWKSDPAIWPHDQMYGMYEETYGQQGMFRFVEIGFSDKPIHSLVQAVHGGRYFIGAQCLEKKVCNFQHASPIPPTFSTVGFTPALTMDFIQ